jgi:membrane associated rhomboid family serine protease
VSETLRLAGTVVAVAIALGVIFGVADFEGAGADAAAGAMIIGGWLVYAKHRTQR